MKLLKALFLIPYTFFLFPFSLSSQVVINEYSCSNINSFADNFGNYDDWIELYNAGGSSVNLTGYYLSNNNNIPLKWKFGNISINANGFLRIWASGQNINTGANLHANFKLIQTKPEPIIFSDGAGIVLDSLTTNPTQTGHSRGRTTNGAATWSVFTTATPNASNTNPKQEYATKPIYSLAPGFYPVAQTVAITSPDAGVTIRYTTDGTTPTATSTAYSSPVNISATTVLKAKAFSSNANIPSSFTEFNTYFINVTHTVPVVSIAGNQVMPLMQGNQSTPAGSIEYFARDKQQKTKATGDFNKHGNDSWSYEQRGIDYITRDEYGDNYVLHDQLFDSKTRKKFGRIILKAAANDNYPFETNGSTYQWGAGAVLEGSCHIRDAYVQTLAQMGGLDLDCRTYDPCILYVNGQYWGVYEIREKVDDDAFTSYYYNQNQPYVEMLQTWGGTWEAYSPSPGVAQADWNTLYNYIMNNSMTVQANYDSVKKQYNVLSLIDYIVLNSYCVTSDWLNWNTMWWRGLDTNGDKKKWRYCLWDEDATFGHYINYTGVPTQNPTADPCNPQQLGDPGGQGHVPILNKLSQNPEFWQEYVSRFIDLSNTCFQCSYMEHLLDSLIAQIAPEMQMHIAKWAPIAGTGSYSDWQNNVLLMKNYISQRCAALTQGMENCYQVTGPYTLTVDVQPAGAGNVKVNSIVPPNYAFSGTYFGNINILLKAIPDSCYIFSHWESTSGDTINPDVFNDTAFFMMESSDTIIAHFVTDTNSKNLTVIVDPPLSGKVNLNSTLINSYPYFKNCNLQGTPFGMIAIPADSCFVFDHWELKHHIINPDSLSDTASFNLTVTDTLIARFAPTPSLTIIVNPPLSGKVNLNNTLINSYPYSKNCNLPGLSFGMIAVPSDSCFIFDHWEMKHHIINPDSLSDTASFNLTVTDTLIAYFKPAPSLTIIVDPPLSGDVNLNSTLLNTYPYLKNCNSPGIFFGMIAIPQPNYSFAYWELKHHTVLPDTVSDTVSFSIIVTDTVIAHFVARYDLTVLVSPLLSGKVKMDGTILPSYPWNATYDSAALIGFVAIANSDYEFDFWESLHHSFNPNTLAESVTMQPLFRADTVTAHFKRKEIPDSTVLHMPDIFTPNGDGKNDFFKPMDIAKVVSAEMLVFNRWGTLIFKTSDIATGWSGNSGSKIYDNGVYFWIVIYTDKDGNQQTQKGTITLER